MNQEKMLYNEIGKNIKKRRQKLGLTQDKLALLTNYSASFIANIESSTYQAFSISALNNIAKALNTTMSNLLPDPEIDYPKKSISLTCKNCSYNAPIPLELTKLLNFCQNITNSKNITLTCHFCQKKIIYQQPD